MYEFLKIKLFFVLLIFIILNGIIVAQTQPPSNKQLEFLKNEKLLKPLILDHNILDVNNILAWFSNYGEFYSDPSVTGPGFEWPKGSGIPAIFSSGLWIGAKYRDTDTTKSIRVATAGHFDSEYRPGKIVSKTGLPDDFTKPEYKIYKVQPNEDNASSNLDYLNWPVNQGAPWIDTNNDGKWDPFVDKIGIKLHNGPVFPDMILFYVYNDADPTFHNHKYGWGRTLPLGVEVRKTAWAYKSLPNVHFLRFEIHNKSSRAWDSTYIGLWSDNDLGDAFDDYSGCDIKVDFKGKRHDLGYTYNSSNADGPPGYGVAPPAVGFKLIQGPKILTSLSDTATSFGLKNPGYINLPMTAFIVFCNPGLAGCRPEWIDPYNAYHTYNSLMGMSRTGKPYINPVTGDTTTFMFDGDPVERIGWLNELSLGPSDTRNLISTGPFNLAPGDSQDIIFASLIERSNSNLNSINKLRKTSGFLRQVFDIGFQKILPVTEVTVKFLNTDSSEINIKSKTKTIAFISGRLFDPGGACDISIELYDDGLHNDELAGDGIFGNSIRVPQYRKPLDLSLNIIYNDGFNFLIENAVSNITTIGPVKIADFNIISDNFNSDGKANPGENLRVKFGISNLSGDSLSNFQIRTKSLSKDISSRYTEIAYVNLVLLPGQLSHITYPPFITLDVSKLAKPETYANIHFEIRDIYGNKWTDTIKMEIHKLTFPAREVFSNITHGDAEGSFGVRIVNLMELKNNIYKVTVEELSTNEKVINLINTSTGDSLLKRHPLPDELSHNIPVTDGFKLTRGTITTQKGLRNWSYTPYNNIWFTGMKGFRADLNIDKRGFIVYPTLQMYGQNSGLAIDSLRRVEIRFDKNRTQKAYRYIEGFSIRPRRGIIHPEFRPFVKDTNGFGALYQDFERYRFGIRDSGYVVPFTVWEVDSLHGVRRQLDIGIIERNDTLYRRYKTMRPDSTYVDTIEYFYYGNIDGRWKPSPEIKIAGRVEAGRRGDEVLLIFGTTYTDTPKSIYATSGSNYLFNNFHNIPVQYVVWMRSLGIDRNFQDGDVFKINPYMPIRHGDVFSFNPAELKETIIPSSYKLSQNYPNPFNAGTNIQYGLPYQGKVQLDIYNILGQKIAVLINNEEQNEGNYTISWDGKTLAGKLAPSGIYFYRILVTSPEGSFTNTKKMVVIR